MNCDICKKTVTTCYHYYRLSLCPKCNGIFRDLKYPDHIPNGQLYDYKVLYLKKIYGKNEY